MSKTIIRGGTGIRQHGQKAHFLDEFTVKGQFKAGKNMVISFLANDDILFESLAGGAGGGGEGSRACVVFVRPKIKVKRADNKENLALNDSEYVDKATGFADYRYQHVHHYWGLSNPASFEYSVFELSHGRSALGSLVRRTAMNMPLVQALDGDTFRVMVPVVAMTNVGGNPIPLNMRPSLTGTNIHFDESFTSGVYNKSLSTKFNHLLRWPMYAIAIREVVNVQQPVDYRDNDIIPTPAGEELT